MRTLIALALLTACEASGPVNAFDAYEVTDPYGDSEPNCPPLTKRQQKHAECAAKGLALLSLSCVTPAQAVAACKAAHPGGAICYDPETGLCAGCWQL